MMCKILKKCVVMLLLFFMPPVAAIGAQTGEAGQVVLYPTDVTEAGDLSYLRESVRFMLASRLASVTGGEVRLEKEMNKGRDFASYRVMSRLVSIKDGVELSAKAYRPLDESPLHFQSVANGSAEIIQALDVLVADMGKALFQLEESPERDKGAGEKTNKAIDPATLHPDRALKINSGFGLSISQEDFTSQMGMKVRTTERYKSAVLSFQSQGMTAGDIDGDSLDEILIATHGKLFIYQLRQQRIQHLATIALPGFLRVHALNVADLDNDGVMEIYLSSTRKKEPRSFVLEWLPATGVKWLYKDVPWYLRPLDIPGEGWCLPDRKAG